MSPQRKIGPKGMTVLKAAGITILAFLLAELLSAPFSASTSAVFSSPEKTDFILSDLYAQVADRRPVRSLSDRIVIVDIDRADREEIAEMIETIKLCEPGAIGIDINFEEPHDDNSTLLHALNASCPVILPLGLRHATAGETDNKDIFEITDKAFFYDTVPGLHYGVVNLPGKYDKASIREFPVNFTLTDSTTLLSFVAAIAKATDPEAFEALTKRGNKLEIIDYASIEIPKMTIEDICEEPERIMGKVVLLGALNEAADTHATPVNRSMSGLAIHAYALSTVLQGTYYRGVPKYYDYMLAAILCFCLVFINISMTAKIKGLVFRFLQLLLAFWVVRIGYEMYVSHRIVANFSITLLMVAFGFFAIDVWNGSIGLSEIASKWWKALRRKFRPE